MKSIYLVIALMLVLASLLADENLLVVGNFSNNSLTDWQAKRFKNETHYQIQDVDGVLALHADSQAAGSGLFFEKHIDLEKTPYLNWRWRISQALTGLDEQSKAGDDFAARIYVVHNGGLSFWQTKALNYVWAGSSRKESVWPNAFAGDHAMMIAVRGPEAPLNVWQTEKRNVRSDLQKMFGEDIRYIDAVALMTDTDNSNRQASADYGDIWFSRD
jgi:hypothetical protein